MQINNIKLSFLVFMFGKSFRICDICDYYYSNYRNMKTNYKGFLTLLLAFVVHIAFAQKTITGVVSDETGPLPGVNVLIQGTNTGTETDFDGNYSIQANQGDVLEFSFIGMKTAYKKVAASNKINVTLLVSDENTLETVVVTAMGIKREKKSLGYALTTVKSEDIQQKPEGDISRVLQGKVAGVNIIPTGGLAGSGNSVTVRTKVSISEDNQPLYVVDGVPFNTGTDNNDGFNGMTGSSTSSRSLDIDPNNIESMSILKGLSATVLYGSAGRNGVILITTKNGNTGNLDKKFEVTVSQTTSISQISNLPEYQNKYGQGAELNFNNHYVGNWGPKFDADVMVDHNYNNPNITQYFPEFIGKQMPYVAVPNNVKDFFRIGVGSNTSVNVSKGGEFASINMNFGHTNEEGFIPGNELKRTTLGVGGNMKLANKLSLDASLNYVNTDFTSPPNTAGNGGNFGSSIFARLMYMPRNFDLMNLPYQVPEQYGDDYGKSLYYREDQDNPRWLLHNAGSTQGVNRFFGKIGVNYDLSDNMVLSYRVGIDQFTEDAVAFSNKGGTTSGVTDIGYLRNTSAFNKTIDQSLMLRGSDYKFGENAGLNFVLGANAKRDSYHQTGSYSKEQTIYGYLHADNFQSTSPIEYLRELNVIGLYSQVEMDFYKYLFLTLAAREDWTSATEFGYKGQFYPSASIAFLPTTAIKGLKSDVLNFLKIRGGYATSAGFPSPYKTRVSINLNSELGAGSAGSLPSQSVDNQIPNPQLRPELIKEIEFGVEGKLYKNRIDFDLSLYKRNTTGLILGIQSDPAVGGTYTTINAGDVQSTGLELGLNLIPIKTDSFKWKINSNFTTYKSLVNDLPEGLERVYIDGWSNLGNYAIEGEPLGVIIGDYAMRDANNNFMVDYTDGTVIDSSADLSLDDKIIGDPNPDYKTTLSNSFKYKSLTLSAQLEYTHGGDVYSLTASNLLRRGVTTASPMEREGAVILAGSLADPTTGFYVDPDGNPITDDEGVLLPGEQPYPNTIPISVNSVSFINTVDNSAENIYDGSVIRLREIALSYDFDKDFINRTPFGSISLSLSGQNLWFDAINMPDAFNFDPEVISTGAGNGMGLEFGTAPTSKKYGFSIKATF